MPAGTRAADLVGLSQAEARERLVRDGPNVIPHRRQQSAARALLAQLTHFFALLLWVAAALALVAGMPELALAIVCVVVINGLFAFIQEHRAERAAERLGDLMPRKATVIRDGAPHAVAAADVVVGDLVQLEAGDAVCADLRLLRTTALAIDTAVLTGESRPEHPAVDELAFAGTLVVEGDALGLVVATGAASRMGGIAELTDRGRRPRTPVAIELDRVVRTVAAIAIAVGVAFFVVGVALGLPASDGFLFAVGVTVALVPEGLLPTVTLSLALGAQRMAGRGALVRRLEAVETLGSATFICTDKTGTLTRNEMSVVEVWTPLGSVQVSGQGYEPEGQVRGSAEAVAAVREVARAAVLCSSGWVRQVEGQWVARGDPTEAALDTLLRRCGVDSSGVRDHTRTQARFPFDSVRRRMSAVTEDGVFVKGAADSVLPRCVAPAPAAERVAHELADQGLRVLAVATRPKPPECPRTADEAERELELIGVIGLEDPPRAGARAAVEACRSAGVVVAMVTGDHPGTAAAVAREVGLAAEGADLLVVTGVDLPEDEPALGELIDREGVVIARVSPEQKLRIAQALQARGHVVAMTGDGVNDGPALRQANIGVAMGRSGTDVAREAADLVLLDDDFSTVVAAIEQGRATFANVRRFLTYHLTDNVAELTPFVVWALSGGRFPLALGVLQILALDIGTDLLPALALGAEPADERVFAQPPVGEHLVDAPLLRRVFGVLGPTEAVLEMGAFAAVLWMVGWRPGESVSTGALAAASGTAFASVVLSQMGNALACRSMTRPPWRLSRRNPFLLWAILTELALLGLFLYLPPVAGVLHQAGPTTLGWMLALLAVPAVLAADALHKWRRQATAWALPRASSTAGAPRRTYHSSP